VHSPGRNLARRPHRPIQELPGNRAGASLTQEPDELVRRAPSPGDHQRPSRSASLSLTRRLRGGARHLAQPRSNRNIVPAGTGASTASRVTVALSTSENTAVLEAISLPNVSTAVGSPGITSLA
jgi:hypothetical protein